MQKEGWSLYEYIKEALTFQFQLVFESMKNIKVVLQQTTDYKNNHIH